MPCAGAHIPPFEHNVDCSLDAEVVSAVQGLKKGHQVARHAIRLQVCDTLASVQTNIHC